MDDDVMATLGSVTGAGMSQRVVELERELTQARNAHQITKEDRLAFEKKVVKVALEYAERNDWCSEVLDALTELGLEHLLPNLDKKVTLTVSLTIEGELGWDDDDYEQAAWDNIRDGHTENVEIYDR